MAPTDTPPQQPVTAAATPRAPSTPRTRPLEGSLRVRSFGALLQGRVDADEVARRAAELDALVQATFRRAVQADAPSTERLEAMGELAALRRKFDALLGACANDGGAPPAPTLFARLEPAVREQLALVLGVPCTPEFAPLLEVKAAEYLEQGRAFDEFSKAFDFVEAPSLGVAEARGALVLTHSGSLLQLSAPGVEGSPHKRRYVYDNLYASELPANGTLRLLDAVCLGARLRSTRMVTSIVRKLRLPIRTEAWQEQSATFERLRQTLRDARAFGCKTIWGAKSEWVPAVHMRSVELERHAAFSRGVLAAHDAARADLRSLILRLADPTGPAHDPVLEASVIGLCLHLQELQVEIGSVAYPLSALSAFETDRAERATAFPWGIRLERPGRSAVDYAAAGIGPQRVVPGSPLALLDAAGSILAVLGDVLHVAPH
jgi:hypothetical protein